MGALNCKMLREGPVVGYAQTRARSQTHEVAVIPTTVNNFPDPDGTTFARLHEIYSTCPRVRKHFEHKEEGPLDREAFYKDLVLGSSHPDLPNGACIPVVVATRWRSDEEWDIAGLISCRGYGSQGDVQDVSQIQIFFRDGHKVSLSMSAIQLAAALFAEMHRYEESRLPSLPTPTPWPRNVEWTIGRQNMEVRRTVETVLVFWGLRPNPRADFQQHLASITKGNDDVGHLTTFPVELRSSTDDVVTVGCLEASAIASLFDDLAGWVTGPLRWQQGGCFPYAGLHALLAPAVASRGSVLVVELMMNVRGTQKKTFQERRDILGADAAAVFELIQRATPPPEAGESCGGEAAIPKSSPVQHRDPPSNASLQHGGSAQSRALSGAFSSAYHAQPPPIFMPSTVAPYSPTFNVPPPFAVAPNGYHFPTQFVSAGSMPFMGGPMVFVQSPLPPHLQQQQQQFVYVTAPMQPVGVPSMWSPSF